MDPAAPDAPPADLAPPPPPPPPPPLPAGGVPYETQLVRVCACARVPPLIIFVRCCATSDAPRASHAPPAFAQTAYADASASRGGVLAPIAQATGPPVGSRSTAKGAGIGGGTAGEPASFTVEAFDATGRRVRDGGSEVVVRVTPTGATAVSLGGTPVDNILVRDARDGAYAVTYTVPMRGDYAVAVSLDGEPVGGSPFPVFFAGSAVPVAQIPLAAAAPLLGVPGAGVCKDFLNARCFRTDCKFSHVQAPAAAAAMLGAMPGGGMPGGAPMDPAAAMAAAQAQAAAMLASGGMAALAGGGGGGGGGGMALPGGGANMNMLALMGLPGMPPMPGMPGGGALGVNPQALPQTVQHFEELGRTLHVGNLSPAISLEQLKQLFGYCGSVVECRIAGDARQFAFVEFASAAEAAQALGLNGMMVGDRPLRVEIAKTVRLVKPATAPNVALQQQLAMAQVAQQAAMQRAALAAQQAQAAAAQQAALRAAEISKRLQAGTAAAAAPGGGGDRDRDRERRRSRSRSRDRRRRSRSRSRSRDRERRRERDRSRSRSRERSRDAKRRGSRERDASRERRQQRDREDRERRERRKGRTDASAVTAAPAAAGTHAGGAAPEAAPAAVPAPAPAAPAAPKADALEPEWD
jgi:arginine/serine-rich splicing factor 12